MFSFDDMEKKLDALTEAVTRLAGSAVPVVEWASSDYIHKRFGINHMSLRALVKGGEVRCKRIADGDVIPNSKAVSVVYRVKDVEEWLEHKAIVPEWAVKVG